uniref:CD44 antigen n=1 Tax=Macaca mulatta TaxID=9544 RepID=A0A5F8A6T9_MACMU
MDKFRWHAAWGLCLLQLSLAQIDLNITCRFAGVFHVEKNGRYSISRTEAADLCKAFNSTLPTMAQMEKALSVGFETCRYGFIEGHVVIPRIQPNSICAANHTGVYILTSNTSQYDTYCFNASAPPKEDCTSVTDLPNAFDGPITITIVNPDGTRYIKKGEYRTNPEDIYPSNPTDDDVSSGSSSERSSTSGGYIFHTFSTAHPIPDEDGPWITDSTDRIPATNMDSSHSTTLQPTADPNTGLVEDLDRTGPLSMTTKQSNSQSFSTSHEGLEEDKDHPTTSTLTSSNRNDVTGGRRDPNHSEGSTTLLEGYTSHYPDTKESRTFIPVTSAKTGSFGVTEVTVGDSNSNVNHSLSGDQDAFYPSGGSHTTHGSESAGHSHGSQEGGANTTSGPVRTPQIPEWLIILASLLALALILAVCIAVNSRRRCGQKKKLVINSGNVLWMTSNKNYTYIFPIANISPTS